MAALDAAMTVVPSVLTAAWITMFETENMALCTPAGWMLTEYIRRKA